MYSLILDGKVLDFKYKKVNELIWNFYVGDIFVGQVFKMRYYWSCVGDVTTCNLTKPLGDIQVAIFKLNKREIN